MVVRTTEDLNERVVVLVGLELLVLLRTPKRFLDRVPALLLQLPVAVDIALEDAADMRSFATSDLADTGGNRDENPVLKVENFFPLVGLAEIRCSPLGQ